MPGRCERKFESEKGEEPTRISETRADCGEIDGLGELPGGTIFTERGFEHAVAEAG